MGTKNQPGKFDCYSRADGDEPLFTLLARDMHAPLVVDMWANQREACGEDPAVVAEARECAEAMREWRSNALWKLQRDKEAADKARAALRSPGSFAGGVE